MAQVPLIRAVVLQIAADVLRRNGAPVERLLRKARLSPGALEKSEALVAFSAVALFLEEAARSEGIEDLGLRIGAVTRVQQLGMFGRLISQALTLQEGLETAYRILPSFSSGEHAWLRRGGEVQLHDRFVIEGENTQLVALSLMLHLNFIRSAAGPGWRPTEVWVPVRRLTGRDTIPMLSDTRLVLEKPEIRITFPADLLRLPLPHSPGGVRPTVTKWLESGPATDVGGAVQQMVTTLLPDGNPDIHLVAEAAQTSARTLQRRLRQEGVTFAGVVARARFHAAQRLLDDPARKVIDVALDLGYSDPAHFTRAFSRWSGITPREFRRLQSTHRQPPTPPL